MDQQTPVRYVGKKPFATDNVASSRKVWNGPGDVQLVTEEQAKILTSYKDQWALVAEEAPEKPVDPGAGLKDLQALAKDEAPAKGQGGKKAKAKVETTEDFKD